MHYKGLLESDYLGQWDLTKPDGKHVEAVVQIAKVERYFPQKRQRKKTVDPVTKKEEWKDAPNRRLMVSFVGKRKKWLAGPACTDVLANMFGVHIEKWVGQKITLYVDPGVTFGKKTTGGIRVRNTAARGPLTEDALDNKPDEDAMRAIEDARGEFYEEEEKPADPPKGAA